jgi:hypothetical protein
LSAIPGKERIHKLQVFMDTPARGHDRLRDFTNPSKMMASKYSLVGRRRNKLKIPDQPHQGKQGAAGTAG